MTLHDPSGVVISLADVYAEVRQTHQEVRDLNAKVPGLVDGQADHEERIRTLEKAKVDPADWADHENRIRGLERGRWPLPSLAVLISIIGLIISTTMWVIYR